MKKILPIIMILTLLLSAYAPPVYAQSIEKLKTGAIEFFTSPLELGRQTAIYTDKYDGRPITGAVAGLLEGTGAFAHKLVSGFFKMMTSPFPGDC